MELARIFKGKKFMLDGKVYADEKEAKDVSRQYGEEGFEVEMVEEGGQHYLFTRRVITEVVVEGSP
jgi:hypothetical protein